MSDWVATLARHVAAGTPAVLVSVVAVKGSAPRAAGTRMIVTGGAVDGTIGGGHLEFTAIDIARTMLSDGGGVALRRFPLGASLGQCCGGVAQLLFEPVAGSASWLAALVEARNARRDCAIITAVRGGSPQDSIADGRLVVTADDSVGSLGNAVRDAAACARARVAVAERQGSRLIALPVDDEPASLDFFLDVVRPPEFRIVLFGAGHVGRALVGVLCGLPCHVTWVDSRDAAFPETVADNIERIGTDAPEAEVAAAAPGTYFLVMTHSHALDERLSEAILARNDFAYFGLIGSLSKRRQFEHRLEARGMPRQRFAAMTCPIGIAGIGGKEPGVIAVAVAAELLQIHARRDAMRNETVGRRA